MKHHKVINLTLKTKTPILIWSGENLLFDDKNKKVVVADEYDRKLFEKNFGNAEVKIKENEDFEGLKELRLFSYYVNPFGQRVRFLPGSTIKGLLRSLILNDVSKVFDKFDFCRLKERKTGKRLDKLNEKNCKVIENCLNNIFRFIQIKDIELEDKGTFKIYKMKNLHRIENCGNSKNMSKGQIENYFEGFSGVVEVEILLDELNLKRLTNEWKLKIPEGDKNSILFEYKSSGSILEADFWNELLKKYSGDLKEYSDGLKGYSDGLKKEFLNRIESGLIENCATIYKNRLNEVWTKNTIKLGFWKGKETYFVGKLGKLVSVNVVDDLEGKEKGFAGLVEAEFLDLRSD